MPCGDNLPVAGNRLDRNFTARQANQAYVGDIAYVRAREGRLHLAVVIGLSSRQAVGWPMAEPIPTGHLWPWVTSAGIASERCVTEGRFGNATPRKACSGTATVAINMQRPVIAKQQNVSALGKAWAGKEIVGGACPLGTMRLREAFFTP